MNEFPEFADVDDVTTSRDRTKYLTQSAVRLWHFAFESRAQNADEDKEGKKAAETYQWAVLFMNEMKLPAAPKINDRVNGLITSSSICC